MNVEKEMVKQVLARRALLAEMAEPRLTRRQRQVMEGLASGATRKEVAHRLGISHSTASVYVRESRQKFKAHTTVELVAKLTQLGLLKAAV